MNIIDKNDERLASEDWKSLFLIAILLLLLAVGYIIEIKLGEPVEYCSKDLCVRELKEQK